MPSNAAGVGAPRTESPSCTCAKSSRHRAHVGTGAIGRNPGSHYVTACMGVWRRGPRDRHRARSKRPARRCRPFASQRQLAGSGASGASPAIRSLTAATAAGAKIGNPAGACAACASGERGRQRKRTQRDQAQEAAAFDYILVHHAPIHTRRSPSDVGCDECNSNGRAMVEPALRRAHLCGSRFPVLSCDRFRRGRCSGSPALIPLADVDKRSSADPCDPRSIWELLRLRRMRLATPALVHRQRCLPDLRYTPHP